MGDDPAAYLEWLHRQTSWIEPGYRPLRAGGEDLEAALVHPRLLIVGEKQAGKTAFLHHVAYLWTCGVQDTRTKTLVLPFLFSLAEVAREGSVPGLLDRLNREIGWGLEPGFFISRLTGGAGILLFDGLDTAPGTASLVEDAAARWPACRFVVTASPSANRHLPGFHKVQIEP